MDTSKSSENAKLFGIDLPISSGLFNILRMGVGFWVILTSFIASQNVQGQLNGNDGFVALGILYTSLSIGSLLSVPIVDRLGERKIFLIGGLSFAFFTFVNIKPVPIFLYAGGLVNGLCASCFWVAQGIYLNRVTTTETRKLYTSIFVAFLAVSHIAGNGITFGLQQIPNFSFSILFAIGAVASVIAAISLMFLLPSPTPEEEPPSIPSAVSSTFAIFKDPEFLLLCPAIVAYGFNLSFIFGSFPSKINDTNFSSLTLTIFGICYLFVSTMGGKVAGYLNGNCLIVISAIGTILGSILATIATDESKWLYLIAGAVLGAMEPGFLIQIFVIFGNDFSSKLNAVNSAFRFLSGGAIAALFFLAVLIPYNVMVIIVNVGQVLSLGLVLFRSYRRTSTNEYKFQKVRSLYKDDDEMSETSEV